MNIITVYTADASKLISVLDTVVRKVNVLKVLASDPARLYNDSNHEDVSMASVTFMTIDGFDTVSERIKENDVFVCLEDSSDW